MYFRRGYRWPKLLIFFGVHGTTQPCSSPERLVKEDAPACVLFEILNYIFSNIISYLHYTTSSHLTKTGPGSHSTPENRTTDRTLVLTAVLESRQESIQDVALRDVTPLPRRSSVYTPFCSLYDFNLGGGLSANTVRLWCVSLQDVNQALVDDGLVDMDKIGSSNFFWSFPSKVVVTRQNVVDSLTDDMAKVSYFHVVSAHSHSGRFLLIV